MESPESVDDLANDFAIPPEIMRFVDDGFLELLSRNDDEKTIEFHMPSLRSRDEHGRITAFTLTWIHPDFNEQFCHYYNETPGDLPNFHVTRDTTDSGDDLIDIGSLDDLEVWLDNARDAAKH